MIMESIFLKNYRNARLELAAMERHLEQCGLTGRPASARAARYDSMPRGTNDVVSARIQEQDGVEAAVFALREELKPMEAHFQQLLGKARNYRDRCILRQYYQHGQTDSMVADCLGVSIRHANRLRKEMLAHFDNTSTMSKPVVECPFNAC